MIPDTLFGDFARLCERLGSTSKKIEKIAVLENFLASLNEDELSTAALFILGKPFPDHDPRTLDVSWNTLQRVLEQVKEREKSTRPLTIRDVSDIFSEIALITGKGSRKRIKEMLTSLFNRASSLEREYLAKIIFGEMRIGVAEGLLLEGIAKAAGVSKDLVRRANMYLGNPGEVAKLALQEGEKGLNQIRLQLFRPVQPMLAELANDLSMVLQGHGGKTSFEFKFDGARVQIHKDKDTVKIYSRHLSDVTASLPDLVEVIQKGFKAESAILEGEVVAVGKNDRPRPFQELMRRFRRVHDIQRIKKEVPIKLYIFDLLYLNGDPLIDMPYLKRWQDLTKISRPNLLVDRLITADENEAEKFLQIALDSGHEGLMAKKLDSSYSPGARGKKWFKIKPAETLDLVIVAADWGSGRRTGWLSNYHLAARDLSSGEFLVLGKTFKGLTDEQFKWMTSKLLSLKRNENQYTVYVKPEVVVEVAYNEIQRSPHYKSEFALRFARIKRIREDKTPGQTDSIDRVRTLYEKQFERKARGAEVAKFK
jgi:DNA ligase-1